MKGDRGRGVKEEEDGWRSFKIRFNGLPTWRGSWQNCVALV